MRSFILRSASFYSVSARICDRSCAGHNLRDILLPCDVRRVASVQHGSDFRSGQIAAFLAVAFLSRRRSLTPKAIFSWWTIAVGVAGLAITQFGLQRIGLIAWTLTGLGSFFVGSPSRIACSSMARAVHFRERARPYCVPLP